MAIAMSSSSGRATKSATAAMKMVIARWAASSSATAATAACAPDTRTRAGVGAIEPVSSCGDGCRRGPEVAMPMPSSSFRSLGARTGGAACVG